MSKTTNISNSLSKILQYQKYGILNDYNQEFSRSLYNKNYSQILEIKEKCKNIGLIHRKSVAKKVFKLCYYLLNVVPFIYPY